MALNFQDGANQYDRFYDYLSDLLQNYTKLGELLTQKLSAIARFDMATLDSIIKEEQVFVLLSRGFDSSIQSYRDKLSLKGDSLSAVITEMPDEFQAKFQGLFVRLKSKLGEVKQLNEKCQSLIEERIYTIERSIHQIDKSSTISYGKPGTPKTISGTDTHIFKKSI